MPDSTAQWELQGFQRHADIWISTEDPDQDLKNEVLEWLLSRMDDPYQGVKREPGFDNLWYGPVPGTHRGYTVVVCAYFILEAGHAVKCNSIATLNMPI